jgi:hypothetical protein
MASPMARNIRTFLGRLRRPTLPVTVALGLLAGCDGAGPVEPVSEAVVADVNGYLATLPAWAEFAPPNARAQFGHGTTQPARRLHAGRYPVYLHDHALFIARSG